MKIAAFTDYQEARDYMALLDDRGLKGLTIRTSVTIYRDDRPHVFTVVQDKEVTTYTTEPVPWEAGT